MIQELNQNILTSIAGGTTSITNEILQPLGMDVACLYTLIIREICDYTPCVPTLWVQA